MSRTFKLCTIYFIAAVWVMLFRIVFSALNLSDNLTNWFFSMIVQIIGLGVIPIVLYKYWAKGQVTCLLRTKTKVNYKVIFIAIIIGFAARHLTIAVAVIWQNFIVLLGFTQINSVGTIFSSPEVLWMELFCTALLPAIFEEITHRGLLQDALADVKNDRTKIIIMAIMFGLMHQSVNQVFYTFIGGLIMAYLAIKSGSLLPAMIVHFINNALSVLQSYSSQTNGLLNYYNSSFSNYLYERPFMLILSWIAAGLIVYFLLVKVKEISAKNRSNSENACVYNNENIYTYHNKSNDIEQLNNVFGLSSPTNQIKTKSKWYEYAFLYATVAVTILTTVFSFIWGYIR